MIYDKTVFIVRILLGTQLVLGGLNWWYKVLPYPSLSDPADMPMKVEVVRSMIDTGWMFGLAKVVELVAGIALLTNVFIPLMLVVLIPITLSTFLLDAFIWDTVNGWLFGEVPFSAVFHKVLDMVFFGGAVFVMQGFLMFAYLHYYAPLFTMTAMHTEKTSIRSYRPKSAGFILESSFCRKAQYGIGILAVILGVLSTGWIILLINEWLLPWSTLKILYGAESVFSPQF